MASNDLSDSADQSDALACRSAVLILRADHSRANHSAAPAVKELSVHLDELLSAVSLELEADLESVPKSVRRAAVKHAAHIAHRSSGRVPRRRAAADRPVERPRSGRRTSRGTDHALDTPFTRSIRLGRTG